MTPKPIINEFMRARRIARSLQRLLDQHRAEERRLKRKAKLLEVASPFNRARANELRESAAILNEGWRAIKGHLTDLGRYLIDLAPEFNLATTFDQRCEILNVNVADRGELEHDHGLVEIACAYGLEDSAYYRGRDWKSGPLFEAMNAEIMRVMFETPEGRAKSEQLTKELFAPGGLFYGVPTMYPQADGSMIRKSADLVVHDQNGARVIERKPGK